MSQIVQRERITPPSHLKRRLEKFPSGGEKDAPLQLGDKENWLYSTAAQKSTARSRWTLHQRDAGKEFISFSTVCKPH